VTVLTVSETTVEERATSCGAREETTRALHLSYPKFSFFSLNPHWAFFSLNTRTRSEPTRSGAVPSAFVQAVIFSLNQPTLNVVQNAKLVAKGEGK